MAVKILSAAIIGIEAEIIEVEADSGGGDFGQIIIVGLPDTATSEAKERVKSALRNSSFAYPKRKITVNLAPANVRKHGPSYDLPIAVSILALKNIFSVDFKNILIIGELSLTGEVRPVTGILAIILKAKQLNITNIFIPKDNEAEASLISGLNIYPVESLTQLINHFKNTSPITRSTLSERRVINQDMAASKYNLNLIKGQALAKRALEIAAAGGHSMLLIGPPGSGKTLLAQSIISILPDLSISEILETTNIHSIAGELKKSARLLVTVPPFRSPHHSSSGIALIGGGTWPRPGEISLAHRGVLFLDEFPEFNRQAIENLRQPMEAKCIHINRAASSLNFPSNFLLIAAMNPCPCGYFGDKHIKCRCSDTKILNYRHKISGPILDRIDLHISVSRINYDELTSSAAPENSNLVKLRVAAARKFQAKRFQAYGYSCNSEMANQEVAQFCRLDKESANLLKIACSQLHLSSRSYFRVLKIARTIADLDSAPDILPNHLAEALQYRPNNE